MSVYENSIFGYIHVVIIVGITLEPNVIGKCKTFAFTNQPIFF
jgi:hypothetical protein